MRRKPSVESVLGLPVAMVIQIEPRHVGVTRSSRKYLNGFATELLSAAMTIAIAGTAIEVITPRGSIFITLELDGESDLWRFPESASSSCDLVRAACSVRDALAGVIDVVEALL